MIRSHFETFIFQYHEYSSAGFNERFPAFNANQAHFQIHHRFTIYESRRWIGNTNQLQTSRIRSERRWDEGTSARNAAKPQHENVTATSPLEKIAVETQKQHQASDRDSDPVVPRLCAPIQIGGPIADVVWSRSAARKIAALSFIIFRSGTVQFRSLSMWCVSMFVRSYESAWWVLSGWVLEVGRRICRGPNLNISKSGRKYYRCCNTIYSFPWNRLSTCWFNTSDYANRGMSIAQMLESSLYVCNIKRIKSVEFVNLVGVVFILRNVLNKLCLIEKLLGRYTCRTFLLGVDSGSDAVFCVMYFFRESHLCKL